MERNLPPNTLSLAKQPPSNLVKDEEPAWISPRITTFPKGVKLEEVLRTASPVTHVPDVAVKRASR
jgi:hypothetical protein